MMILFDIDDTLLEHTAAEAQAAQQSQCVYVGDRLAIDAEAAYQAGWIGIWVDRTASEMVPADVIRIPDLGALPRVIAQGGADTGLFVAPGRRAS